MLLGPLLHLHQVVGGRWREVGLVWRRVCLSSRGNLKDPVSELAGAGAGHVVMAGHQVGRVAREMVASTRVLAGIQTNIVTAIEAAETVAGAVGVRDAGTPALGGRVRTLLHSPPLVVGARRWACSWRGHVSHVVW